MSKIIIIGEYNIIQTTHIFGWVCQAKCGLFIFNIFIILHKLVIIFNNDYQFFILLSYFLTFLIL